jgi:hypothetical protein
MLLRGSGWNNANGGGDDDAAELTEEERLALEAELRAAEEEERRRQAEEEMARRCGQRHTQTRTDRQIERQTRTDRHIDRQAARPIGKPIETHRERATKHPARFCLLLCFGLPLMPHKRCFAKTGSGLTTEPKLAPHHII